MILVTVLILSLCLYKSKIYRGFEFNENALGFSETIKIRNIFATLIVVHHASGLFFIDSRVEFVLSCFYNNIGHLICAGFFFYSAFGLYKKYVSTCDARMCFRAFFFQSLLPLLLIYVAANFIKLICKLAVDYQQFDFYRVFACLVGFELVDATHWFFIVLLFFYLLFFMLVRFHKLNFSIFFMVSLVYIFLCMVNDVGGHWFVSVLAFPVGILFSEYEDKFLTIMKKSYQYYLALFSLGSLGVLFFIVFLGNGSMDSDDFIIRFFVIISAAIFPLLVLQIALKFSANDNVRFFGDISLGLYVLHPIFIKIIDRLISNSSLNVCLVQFSVFVLIVILFPSSYFFQVLTKKMKSLVVSVNTSRM